MYHVDMKQIFVSFDLATTYTHNNSFSHTRTQTGPSLQVARSISAIYTATSACQKVHIYTYTHTYMHTHTYIHTHIHTYIHTKHNRALAPGGEFYFSDVYCDRRLPESVRRHGVLWGECIAGALYVKDFERMARDAGDDMYMYVCMYVCMYIPRRR
jgi:hypothetical protein